MKFYRLTVVIIFLFCAMLNITANEKEFSPWDGWRRGYERFQQAEKLMRAGDLEEALELYKEAQELYRKVSKARPDWNQNVIKTRLANCQKQIDKIEQSLSGNVYTPKVDVSTSQATSTTKPSSLIDEGDYKKKYFELFIEVENLRKQLRNRGMSSQNLEALIKENQSLKNRYNSLMQRYKSHVSTSSSSNAEVENIQKLLIAEKLKFENADKKVQILTQSYRKSVMQLKAAQDDLVILNQDLQKQKQLMYANSASQENLNKAILTKNNQIDSLKNTIAKNLAIQERLNNDLNSKVQEIEKLNKWVDQLQAKSNEDLSNKVIEENRKLKVQYDDINKEFIAITEKMNISEANLQKITTLNSSLSKTIKQLESQKENSVIELNSLREQYLRQVEAEKINKAELANLKEEHKKNFERLNLLVAKNEELALQLKSNSNSSDLNFNELQKVRKELEAEELKHKNIVEKLNNQLLTLTEEYNKLKLDSSKNNFSEKKIILTDNEEYDKLKLAYKNLQEKYDFLAMEIESLSKPMAEIGEASESTISSDDELKSFLVEAATESVNSKDYSSAVWYYSELEKLDATAKEYKNLQVIYLVLAENYQDAKELIENFDSKEKEFFAELITASSSASKDEINKVLKDSSKLNFKESEKNALEVLKNK